MKSSISIANSFFRSFLQEYGTLMKMKQNLLASLSLVTALSMNSYGGIVEESFEDGVSFGGETTASIDVDSDSGFEDFLDLNDDQAAAFLFGASSVLTAEAVVREVNNRLLST